MMRFFPAVGLMLVLSTAVFGQSFEVASVKAAVRSPGGAAERSGGGGMGGRCPTSLKMDGGRVEVRCATLPMLIGYAYRISPDRVSGPDWMTSAGSPRFDIAATIPRGASAQQVPEMFQALLADRFQLSLHRENKRGEVYGLVVEKGGLKLKDAPAAAELGGQPTVDGFFGAIQTSTIANADGRTSTTTLSNARMGTVLQTGEAFQVQRWEAPSISLEGLADLLDKVLPLSSPVVDTTGRKGRFSMVLEISLRDARPGSVSVEELEAVVLKAANEGLRKLGLKLERRKGSVDALVVDRVRQAPTEN